MEIKLNNNELESVALNTFGKQSKRAKQSKQSKQSKQAKQASKVRERGPKPSKLSKLSKPRRLHYLKSAPGAAKFPPKK